MKPAYSDQCFDELREFLMYLEVVRGRSKGTVEEYFHDLRLFFRFMKQRRGLAGADAEKIPVNDINIQFIRDVTLMDVYEYLNHAKNVRGNNVRALARKATSLRMFFKFHANYTHKLDNNPLQNLDTPKIGKSLPKYLTLEQSIELLGAADGIYAERDYCMLTLLLNCGLRRAELAGLNIRDIRSDNTMRVRGKGGKERIIYLNEACLNAIEQYLPTRPINIVSTNERDALFYSHRKKRISLQGIHYVVKGYLKQIEGLEEYSTHKLRHTAATLMYRNGVDIRVLKEVLGHNNIGTTEIYTHLSGDQMKNAALSNPLANIKVKKSGK